MTPTHCDIVLVTEGKSGTTEKLPFAVNTAVELQNMTATSLITGTLGR